MKLFEKAATFWRHFKEAQSGASAVIFAIMVIPLFVISGGAVDYGRALKTKSQLTMALDAAILAAMKEYSLDTSTEYKKVIEEFITKNLAEEDKTYLGQELEITVSEVGDNGEMTASVATDVSTHFLKLIGFNEFSVNVSSAAMAGGQDLEVVLVLDNTGSMRGSKIRALRDSATDLVNILIPDSGESRVRVALVPFAEYVNIGMDRRTEEGLDIPDDYTDRRSRKSYKWYGCMGSRKHALNVKDEDYGTAVPGMMMRNIDMDNDLSYERCPGASVIDLTDEKSVVTAGIADMTAKGWTYIPSGLSWGWRVLSNEAPFTSGVPDTDEDTTKVIVLMTDGANTRAPKKWNNGATVKHSVEVWGHSVPNGSGANPLTTELCNNIKEKNIVIFTIAFDVRDGSSVEKLMRACAGNGGQFFDADNDAQLEDAFRQIGLSLLNLRLSQ